MSEEKAAVFGQPLARNCFIVCVETCGSLTLNLNRTQVFVDCIYLKIAYTWYTLIYHFLLVPEFKYFKSI